MRFKAGVRAAIALAASVLALTGCGGVLDPQGSVGSAEKTILIDSVGIMLAIVLPTIAATFAFGWWFRASNAKARYLPNFAYSGQLELVVWGIPLMVILLLGGVAWIGSHDLDPYKPLPSQKPALNIQGVSLDWKWLFIYPDQHIATVNQLVVPAGVPVHFALTSGSVMNAFFVPRLGSMIYTMNGMATQLSLQADRPGTFHGLSSHYSGDGFSGMHFDVRAVPDNEFNNWVKSVRDNGGPALDDASYAQVARQSLNVQPFTYRDADAALFDKIVNQTLPPAAGPPTDTDAQKISPKQEK